MTETSATRRAGEQKAEKNAIRPFQMNFPEAELTELRKRINATKWPERETVVDASLFFFLSTAFFFFLCTLHHSFAGCF